MEVSLIVHDIRSIHNVGSLLRTAEGMGVDKVFFSGYTPYPRTPDDDRLPHIISKLSLQINKTALGAETMVNWEHCDDVSLLIKDLKAQGVMVCALEQTTDSVSLPDFRPDGPVALLLGREVEGIEPGILKLCDTVLEIPMFGQKESFNVVQAAAMALYQMCVLGQQTKL